jgi:hypothetical protein
VQSPGGNDATKRIAGGPTDDVGLESATAEGGKGAGIMSRALGIAKMIGSLLAIELFVPGGTLIVLTLLVTGSPGSRVQERIAGWFPGASRLVSRIVGSASPFRSAVGRS